MSDELANIKRHYENKNNKSDIVNLPIMLRRTLFIPNSNTERDLLVKAPISAIRLIFKCLEDISYDQFLIKKNNDSNKKSLAQLSLFEEEFLTVNNNFVRFTFNIKSITDDKNYDNVKKGLEFLESYKKTWYTSKNSKNQDIKSYGGFISNPSISNSNITFLMSAFWYEKILVLSNGYNPTFKKTAWLFSNMKQILFYLFIIELDNGIKISFETINERFSLNYKTAIQLAKGFLKPIRDKLNRSGLKSFNYSIKLDMINIVVYHPKKLDINLKDETIKEQLKRQRLNYWKKRHLLNTNNIDKIKNCINIDATSFYVLENSYNLMVKDFRKSKKIITDLIDDDFMKIFQEYIITFYATTSWYEILKNGHPIL